MGRPTLFPLPGIVAQAIFGEFGDEVLLGKCEREREREREIEKERQADRQTERQTDRQTDRGGEKEWHRDMSLNLFILQRLYIERE